MATVEHIRKLIRSKPVMQFLLLYADKGAANMGAVGFSLGVAMVLEELRLVEVFHYKPFNPAARRHYRAVARGDQTKRFAVILTEELRAGNLAAISGWYDGVGRVAMNADWKERKQDVLAAVDRSVLRWVAERFGEQLRAGNHSAVSEWYDGDDQSVYDGLLNKG